MALIKKSLFSILVGAVFLNGCTSWRTMEGPPEVTSPEHARVILKNGRVIEIKEALVSGNSFVGNGKRTVTVGWRREIDHWDLPVTVPLENIQEIKTRQVSAGKTVLLVTGSVVVLGAIAGGVALATWDYNWNFGGN